MPTRKLDKKEWRSFLDHLSTTLEGKEAEIEGVSLQLGDQVEADWLPLLGIAYDPNDDIVEVALEDLDHLIAKPRELYVEEGPGGLAALGAEVGRAAGPLGHAQTGGRVGRERQRLPA